jgi:hypothetical protein
MKAFAIFLSWIILSCLVAFSAEAAAPDAKRVALVIGNSKYVHAVTLPNPANDARLIASTLRNAGFEVIEGVDQDNAGMHGLINRFTEQSYDADLAVIFYAGHGMQVDGKNYLIPVDAELTSAAYLKTRTIQIDDFMAALHLTLRSASSSLTPAATIRWQELWPLPCRKAAPPRWAQVWRQSKQNRTVSEPAVS